MAIETGSALFKCFLWIANKFGKEIIKGSAKKITKKAKSQFLKGAAKTYEDEMRNLYDTIRVIGMVEPMSLKGIYTYVNVLKPGSIRRTSPDKLKQIYLDRKGFGNVEGKSKAAMSVVNTVDKLFVLGKPGAGKTTLLKNITMSALDGTLPFIPIYIQLKIYSESGQTITEFIENQFEICNFSNAESFIKMMLQYGKAVVIFDGLDEVSEQANIRTKVIQELVNFSNQFRKNKIVISCRVAATDYSFEKFKYVEIADFTDDQIDIFTNKWFKSNEDLAKSFNEQFKNNKKLRDMASTPLLLTLLCISFTETGFFSDRETEIYEDAIDALLKKWDVSRNIFRDEKYRFLPRVRKLQMFQYIATVTFEKQEFIVQKKRLENLIHEYLVRLPNMEDITEIEDSGVLKSIEAQHGIFIERSKGLYTFAHLTLQEYFTAVYIAEASINISIKDLAKNFVSSRRWDVTIRMYLEMTGSADRFLIIVIDQIRDILKKFKPLVNRDYEICQRPNVEELLWAWTDQIADLFLLGVKGHLATVESIVRKAYDQELRSDENQVSGDMLKVLREARTDMERMENLIGSWKRGGFLDQEHNNLNYISMNADEMVNNMIKSFEELRINRTFGMFSDAPLVRPSIQWKAYIDMLSATRRVGSILNAVSAGLRVACISDRIGTLKYIFKLI